MENSPALQRGEDRPDNPSPGGTMHRVLVSGRDLSAEAPASSLGWSAMPKTRSKSNGLSAPLTPANAAITTANDAMKLPIDTNKPVLQLTYSQSSAPLARANASIASPNASIAIAAQLTSFESPVRRVTHPYPRNPLKTNKPDFRGDQKINTKPKPRLGSSPITARPLPQTSSICEQP
jgi:hypothetical protein